MAKQTLTTVLQREGDWWVALCPEIDVASQGRTIEQATANLREAVELFLDAADPEEIRDRFHSETYIGRMEIDVA